MIEIRINREIGTYEPKIIGPFTLRQLICITCAAPVCLLIYNVCAPVITPDLAGFLCFIPAVIAYFFGWRKPYGMPTEKFLQSIFITTLMAPADRPYKSVNRQEQLIKKLSSDPEDDSDSEAPKVNNKKKRNIKFTNARYKVSPLAIK